MLANNFTIENAGDGTSLPGFVRRNRLVLLVSAVLVGLITTSVFFVFFYVPEGPLAGSGSAVRISLDDGETSTWGIPLQPNRTNSDIVIDSIDPVSVSGGIEIIGITVTIAGSVVTDRGYPPDGLPVTYPRGAVIPALDSEDGDEWATVFFGVRRKTGIDEGLIEGVRIKYHIGSRRYETVIDSSLRVMSPELWAQPQLLGR